MTNTISIADSGLSKTQKNPTIETDVVRNISSIVLKMNGYVNGNAFLYWQCESGLEPNMLRSIETNSHHLIWS